MKPKNSLKNNIIEAGSYITLSSGFYIIAPYTTQVIERYTPSVLGGLTLIFIHSIIAAILIKVYFKIFPSKKETISYNEMVDMVRENRKDSKKIFEKEFNQEKKK